MFSTLNRTLRKIFNKPTQRQQDIVDQLEYYLSDTNLDCDKYIRTKVFRSKERYVKLKVFMSMNRMKRMGVTEEETVEALRFSRNLELSPDRKSIRTRIPYEKDYFRSYRTLKVKGFDRSESRESILAILSQSFTKINRLSLYRRNGDFTGTVVFEVEDQREAELIAEIPYGEGKLNVA